MWKLLFDGSKCLQGTEVAIILIYNGGGMIPIAQKMNFECNNNMVEYEALILRLKEAINLGISKLQVYGDSQLIISQINNVYNKILFENSTRNNNRFAKAMDNINYLIPKSIEDEDTIIKLNNVKP